jgi:tetratricopeptide (TPR) repeat protein
VSAQNDPHQNRLRLAQDFERTGNFDAALRVYQNLFEQVPNNQLYYEGLKRNLIRLKRYAELISIIDTQAQATSDPKYQADLGNVYYKSGEMARAHEIWSAVLQDHASNSAVYPNVAAAMIDNQLYDEAIDVYKLARKNLANNELYVFELANIYIIRLNYKEATLEYLKYLEKNPGQFNYIEGRLASFTTDAEHAGPVAEVIKAELPTTGQPYLVRKLLADLYLRIEDYGRSLQEFKLLENMTSPQPQVNKEYGEELYFFAEKALQANQYQFAQQGFDLILAKYKDSPFKIRALFGLAMSRQKQGLSQEAIQSYFDLASLAPQSPWAQESLFQIGEINFVDFFDVDKALEAYQGLLQKYPRGSKTMDAYLRIGDCYTAKGNLKEAQTWYEKPLDQASLSWYLRDQALYKSAYVDFVNGDFEDATEKLNQIVANMGEKQISDQSFVNDALELTMLIGENQGNDAPVLKLYADAQKLKLQRKTGDAIDKLQEILASYPTAGIVDESLLELGELEDVRKSHSRAIGYFEDLLQQHPQSVHNALAQKRIAEIYEAGLGDLQKASAAYERILIEYPQSSYVEAVRQKLRQLQGRQLNN